MSDGAPGDGDLPGAADGVFVGRTATGGDGDAAPKRRSRRRLSSRGPIERLVVRYMLAALGAFVLCGVGLALAQRQAALQETVRDAESTAALLATRVVQPALPRTSSASTIDDQAFDRLVRERVLVAPVTRAQLVDETGSILYDTDARAAGQREDLSAAEREAARSGGVAAEQDDGSDPTSLLSDHSGRALEVSAGLRGAFGQPLLLRTTQASAVAWQTSRAVFTTLLPSLVLALVLLYLVKIGFTYRLTRSLRTVQDEREQLLVTALAAADRERTLIASDLHDGVVQGLTGASYTLTDTANRTRAAGQPELADDLAGTARNLRQSVRELRSLIVTVTPPALHSEGLQTTLSDLVAILEARQIAVQLEVDPSDGLSETDEALVYRVAQEAVRNIVRHAHASAVHVSVTQEAGDLELEVTDDGQGFDPQQSTRRHGSVGLPLLAALVQERGGRLRVASAAGSGTTVTLRLPSAAAPQPEPLAGTVSR
ncbi:sensor histidine kinase [Microlunatus flavus]|uniref:Oxygen sensor histidine kinase NreB n=1 Tax=Microlunatus flavus TaxID=1036181 RepID=A0A1H9KU37_9ACTN|nr:ATP-binding protein [Microlunatus flavus]SER02549.1 Signal transduction histidine kinase [Microlunatus flavus]